MIKSIMVVDDFYDNPHEKRSFALEQEYKPVVDVYCDNCTTDENGNLYIPNSCSKFSSIVASAKTFFNVDIVRIVLPGFTKMFSLISEKFLRTESVWLLTFIFTPIIIY